MRVHPLFETTPKLMPHDACDTVILSHDLILQCVCVACQCGSLLGGGAKAHCTFFFFLTGSISADGKLALPISVGVKEVD